MARKLPLDDPRWLPMKAAVDLRAQQTGDLGVAFLDLQQDLANDKLACMRRNRASNKREPVDAPEWKPHVIDLNLGWDSVSNKMVPIKKVTQYTVAAIYHRTDDDWLYYVWRLHFDRLYAQPAVRLQRKPKQRERKGRRPALTPEQQEWLRETYGRDLKANPLLARDKKAIPHVQGLAKEEFKIDAPARTTLLEQIIRPVRRSPHG